jgi:hypothetical protein
MNFKDIIFLFLTGMILMYLIVVNININNIYKELSNLNHKPGIINIGK